MFFISRLKHNFYLMTFERVFVLCGSSLATGGGAVLWVEVIAGKKDECDDGERLSSVASQALC